MAEYITCQDEKGSINISDDVVAVMARTAAAEVEGVAGLAHTAGGELAELLAKKSNARGVKVQFEEGRILIDVLIMVRYGYAIATVAKKVQSAVTGAVEDMSGFVPTVNVHVSGVAFDK